MHAKVILFDDLINLFFFQSDNISMRDHSTCVYWRSSQVSMHHRRGISEVEYYNCDA